MNQEIVMRNKNTYFSMEVYNEYTCDMELKKKHRNTIVYVDKKTDRYYSYSSTSGSIYLGNSLGYLKEKRNGTM